VRTLNLHVERIVVEGRAGAPPQAGALAEALRTALERELDSSSGDPSRAIERAVHAAFAPAARRRA
jgi:hypothetical protein